MKALKPSHRENKRYLLIEGKDANPFVIEEVILEFVGVFGYSEACPQIIKKDKDKIIISINREALNKIRTAVVLSNKILKITKVSGSVSKLKF